MPQDRDSESGSYTDSGRGPSEEGENAAAHPPHNPAAHAETQLVDNNKSASSACTDLSVVLGTNCPQVMRLCEQEKRTQGHVTNTTRMALCQQNMDIGKCPSIVVQVVVVCVTVKVLVIFGSRVFQIIDQTGREDKAPPTWVPRGRAHTTAAVVAAAAWATSSRSQTRVPTRRSSTKTASPPSLWTTGQCSSTARFITAHQQSSSTVSLVCPQLTNPRSPTPSGCRGNTPVTPMAAANR